MGSNGIPWQFCPLGSSGAQWESWAGEWARASTPTKQGPLKMASASRQKGESHPNLLPKLNYVTTPLAITHFWLFLSFHDVFLESKVCLFCLLSTAEQSIAVIFMHIHGYFFVLIHPFLKGSFSVNSFVTCSVLPDKKNENFYLFF